MFYPSVDNLFDEMFNFDDDFFEPKPERGLLPSHRGPKGRHGALMRTDVKETKKAYKLSIDLPGYKKDDIKVKFDDDKGKRHIIYAQTGTVLIDEN